AWFADLAHPSSRDAAVDALTALGVEAVPVWHEVLDTGHDANADARGELLVALRDLTEGDWFPGVPALDDMSRGYLSIEGPESWGAVAWGALVQLPPEDPAVMRAALTGAVTHRYFGNSASRAVLLGADDRLGELLAEFVAEVPDSEDDVPFAALRIAARRPGCGPALLPVFERLFRCPDGSVGIEAAAMLHQLGAAGRDLAHRRLARELARPGDSKPAGLIGALLDALGRFDTVDARDVVVAERVLNHVLSLPADDIDGDPMLLSALALLLPAKPGHPTGMKRLRALLDDPVGLWWEDAVDLATRLGPAGAAEVPRIRKAAGNPPTAESSTAICLRRLEDPQANALAAQIAGTLAPFEVVVALMQHMHTDPDGCRWLLDTVLAATPPSHKDRGRIWRAGAFFDLIRADHVAAITADLRSTNPRTRRAAATAAAAAAAGGSRSHGAPCGRRGDRPPDRFGRGARGAGPPASAGAAIPRRTPRGAARAGDARGGRPPPHALPGPRGAVGVAGWDLRAHHPQRAERRGPHPRRAVLVLDRHQRLGGDDLRHPGRRRLPLSGTFCRCSQPTSLGAPPGMSVATSWGVAITIPVRRPRVRALTVQAERAPFPRRSYRLAMCAVWFGGVLGSPFLLFAAYAAWDLAPYLTEGRGRLFGIAGYLAVAGALLVAAPLWQWRRRRTTGRGLRLALWLCAAGAGALAWPAIPLWWAVASAPPGPPTPIRLLIPPGQLLDVWIAAHVATAFGLIFAAVSLLAAVGRGSLARIPARPVPVRRRPRRFIDRRRLAWFVLLPAAALLVLLIVGGPSAPAPRAPDPGLRPLQHPIGRQGRIDALVARGPQSAPLFARWMAAEELPGTDRRRAVLNSMDSLNHYEAPVPVIGELVLSGYRLDGPRTWRRLAPRAIERIARRTPDILSEVEEAFRHAGSSTSTPLEFAAEHHGSVAVSMYDRLISDPREGAGWTGVRELVRLVQRNPEWRAEVVAVLRRACSHTSPKVRQRAVSVLSELDAHAQPWLRAAIGEDEDRLVSAGLWGYLRLQSIGADDVAAIRPLLDDDELRIADLALAVLVRHRPSDRSLDLRVQELWSDPRQFTYEAQVLMSAIAQAGPAAGRHLEAAHPIAAGRTYLDRSYLNACASVGGPAARTVLAAALPGGYRYRARRAMVRYLERHPADAVQVAEDALGSSDPDTRAAVLLALSRSGRVQARHLRLGIALLDEGDGDTALTVLAACRHAPLLPAEVRRAVQRFATRTEQPELRLRCLVIEALQGGAVEPALREGLALMRKPGDDFGPGWILGVLSPLGGRARPARDAFGLEEPGWSSDGMWYRTASRRIDGTPAPALRGDLSIWW
ncbi:MAG: hypothetical protein ACYTGX_14690, partial [Planctomycetota bacterium]